jgi:hypothetical protein
VSINFPAPDSTSPHQHVFAGPLWILTRAGDFVAAELCQHGRWGWELQLRQGAFYSSRRFERREDALAYAETVRQEKLEQGWL